MNANAPDVAVMKTAMKTLLMAAALPPLTIADQIHHQAALQVALLQTPLLRLILAKTLQDATVAIVMLTEATADTTTTSIIPETADTIARKEVVFALRTKQDKAETIGTVLGVSFSCFNKFKLSFA